METRLLDVLVCPLCKGPLRHDREQEELVCKADKLAFPIVDGIPTMLVNEARQLKAQDPASN
ncbi:Trm112 family protein [Alcaligenes aquatilis]|uniref:Trm112 family protein n=1 Tax=Alcaligenes aquatilis TaxID=323284 RepID=UPI000F6744B8|nr:Trm112 family protein [Alcaligenes aquatilis]QXR37371.1 Trm112 family protein [Alcaligenes aquatilis]